MLRQIVFVAFCAVASIDARHGWEDGSLYEIKSRVDKRVLTSFKSPDAGSKVFLDRSEDDSNQKWLAVQIGSDDEHFVLLPKHQSWDWDEFKRKSLKHRSDSLPEKALVLTEDKGEQAIMLEKYREKKSQQWRSVKIEGKNYYLLKNVGSDKCIKNLNKKQGIFSKIKSEAKHVMHKDEKRAKNSHPETVNCDKSDKGQHWELKQLD